MGLFGRAAIKGIGGVITYSGIAATVDALPQSASIDNQAVKTELKDSSDKTVGFSIDDPQKVLQIEFTPVAGDGVGENTTANAASAVNEWDLPIGSVVTTSGFAVDWMNGDWNIDAVGARFNKSGYASVPMTLRQYDGAALAAVAS